MLVLYLALIGIIVGIALDAVVERLAVRPDDPEQDGEATEPARTALHGEAGTLVLERPYASVTWLRRLLIVATTAGLFAAAAARFEPSQLALITAYLAILITCAATDALSYRVPNVITYPAIVLALVVGATMPDADLLGVVAGGALAGGVLFLPSLITGGRGMGMGDVKLAAFVGLAVGFDHVTAALLMMALTGGAAALVLLVTGLRSRGDPIAYAPFIAAGALATILWQGTAFANAG